MQDSDGGEPIVEQFDKQRKCLRNEPEEGTPPAEGYKQSGRQLHHTLSQTKQDATCWVERLIVHPCFRLGLTTFYVLTVWVLILGTPVSNWAVSGINIVAVSTADYPILVPVYEGLTAVVGFILILLISYLGNRQTVSMIENWVASNKPSLSICLGFDDDYTPGKMAIISNKNYDRIEATYEELGAPGQLKGKREAKTISYADLLGISAEEFALQNLHVAEWTSSEGSPSDSLLAQGENTLTEVDSIHLPLDKIAQLCRKEDTHCCIQVLITPRNGKRIKKSFNLKRQGKPTNEHIRALNLLLDGIFPEDNSSNDTNQKTDLTERQLEKFANFDTEYTFNIQVQAVVYDSQSGHSEHAESIFNTVDAAVGVAMKNTIKRTVPTSEAGKQELLQKIVTQKPSQSSKLSNLTSLRSWKRTLRFWTNRQAIVTDSNRVWTFALLSTKTGDGQSWIHDTPTRDQQPTDLPPEENLDQFRANDDDKS